MTDGHSYQLSQRSVVGIGVAKGEVKDVEDHYAWSTVNIVGNGPVSGVLANLDRGAGSTTEDWTRP